MDTNATNSIQAMKLCIAKASAMLIAVILLGYAFPGTPWFFVTLFFGGWLAWTFFEYCVHRFLMHELLVPSKEEKIFNHKHHHQNPHDLAVKPIHRFAVFLLCLAVFLTALKLNNAFTIFAGFTTGFLGYNLLHYLLHQPFCKCLFPKIQRSHILHHTRYPNCGFSFSTTLWDWLFDTLPPKDAQVTPRMAEVFFGKTKKRNPFSTPRIVSRPHGNPLLALVTILTISVFDTACVPVFSDLQSARLVGKGQVEVTPYYTSTGMESESDGANHVGANFAVGLSPKVDLRGRLEANWIKEGSTDYIIGMGPKASLMENRIAAFLPIGYATNSEVFQLQPTMLFTLPFAKEKLEATLAPKYLISLCEDCESNFATNFGLGFSPNFDRWAVRAEYGRMFAEDGVGQFSLGISFHVNPKD
ncbi:sterol desaturase family protein [Algoriphagus aestuariicola]|uniref:Sterol desaturase family protein n=1 Tax=Algoriphagus aestuariicola TaxID=1852016 RepID=A0ABS3BVP7_9BACT|nr:sterol desaturase family protein [Algoriphagus aestuariicola]MBN7803198.1 sterol desaturase family protein [Algoriphagus aestuariicola]